MPPSSAFSAVRPTLTHPAAPQIPPRVSQAPIANSSDPHATATGHWIEISFNDLSAFEIVQSQYSAWGIHFERSIAVQPTNAGFGTDQIGIMPLGEPLKLTIAFQIPPRRIYLLLTGANIIHATLLHPDCPPTLYPLRQRLAVLHPTRPDQSAPLPNTIHSAPEFLPFPQYELDFTPAQYWNRTIAPDSLSHSSIDHIDQVDRIELQSTSPFVLQSLAIEIG